MRKYLLVAITSLGMALAGCSDNSGGGRTYYNEAVFGNGADTVNYGIGSGTLYDMGTADGVRNFEIALDARSYVGRGAAETGRTKPRRETPRFWINTYDIGVYAANESELIYLNFYTDADGLSGTYTFGEGRTGRKLRDGNFYDPEDGEDKMITRGTVKVADNGDGTYAVDFNLLAGNVYLVGNYTGALGIRQIAPVEISFDAANHELTYYGDFYLNGTHNYDIYLEGNGGESVYFEMFSGARDFATATYKYAPHGSAGTFRGDVSMGNTKLAYSSGSVIVGVNDNSGDIGFTVAAACRSRHGVTMNVQYSGTLPRIAIDETFTRGTIEYMGQSSGAYIYKVELFGGDRQLSLELYTGGPGIGKGTFALDYSGAAIGYARGTLHTQDYWNTLVSGTVGIDIDDSGAEPVYTIEVAGHGSIVGSTVKVVFAGTLDEIGG